MYSIKFELKQHTPIIHFQHEQEGATLRASELKPKLDRFILNKLGKGDYENGKIVAKERGWLIGDGKKGALDYMVKIKETSDNIDLFLPYPVKMNSNKYPRKEENLLNYLGDFDYTPTLLMPCPYFANADKIHYNRGQDTIDITKTKVKEIRFGILNNEFIKIFFYSYHSSITEYIQGCFNEFMLNNNFGTRQNKGFGSFTLMNPPNINNNFIFKSRKPKNSIGSIFRFIDDEYKLLKAGTNRPYKKSELFKYFINDHSSKTRWEKRYIKQKLNKAGVSLKTQENLPPLDIEEYNNQAYNDWEDCQDNEYGFIRALLGLPENYEFQKDRSGKEVIKVKHNSSSSSKKIERFKSPIFFKVIDGTIYISINQSYKNIEGENFEFYQGTSLLGNLNIPSSFDLNNFLKTSLNPNSQWTKI